jgi:hypothetical protein
VRGMIKLVKTIDNFVGLNDKQFFPIDVFRFCYDEFIEKATDYSAFRSFSKRSMEFDAKANRLERGIDYIKKLLEYAQENFGTNSRVKQQEIVKAGEYLAKKHEDLMNRSTFSRNYRCNGGHKNTNEERKPESYKAHGNFVYMVDKKQGGNSK